MLLDDYDEFDLNYDLDKVPKHDLPNPLIFKNGSKITSHEQWEDVCRKELINLFCDNLYGHIPGKFKDLKISILSIDKNFLNSLATKKEIRIHLNKKIFIDLLIFLPNNLSRPKPIFLGMNFFGNHSISKENIASASERISLEIQYKFSKKK